MRLVSLELLNFRNIRNFQGQFSNRFNLLIGDNGQGKTNVIESIYLTGTARSFRRTSTSDQLITAGESFSRIKTEIVKNDILKQTLMDIYTNQRRSISLNGKKVHKFSDYIGNINVTLFSPEDLMIIKGEASIRRNFLDTILCQTDPIYMNDLSNYYRILKQRNAVLKDIQAKKQTIMALDPWDAQLPTFADKIVKKRVEIVKKLSNYGKFKHNRIISDEVLGIFYISSLDVTNYWAEFTRQQKSILGKEILRGVTLIGPHRDDLGLTIYDQDARAYGSQGQQRTIAISLRMAEMEYIREITGEYPILLLDDIFSELDDKRKALLLSILQQDIQTFLTGTRLSDFTTIQEQARIFSVKKGIINHVQ